MISDRPSRAISAGILLALLATAVPVCMAAGGRGPERKQAAAEELSWQLSGARVVRSGAASEIGEGTLTNGYTVESDATVQGGGDLMPKGKFRLMATVFSPKADRPGQQAGRWYLRGSWSITGEPVAGSHSAPTVFKGDLAAELPFNPAASKGSVEARVRMPKVPAGKRWGPGSGTFSGNERFEGVLTLTLDPDRK